MFGLINGLEIEDIKSKLLPRQKGEGEMDWKNQFEHIGFCAICKAEMWRDHTTNKIYTDHQSNDHVCTNRQVYKVKMKEE